MRQLSAFILGPLIKIGFPGLVVLLCGHLALAATLDKRLIDPDGALVYGVYDPSGDFKSDRRPSLEHVFMPWVDGEVQMLETVQSYALAHGRTLMITVEPWSWLDDKKFTSSSLYEGIMAGRFDANMQAICAQTSKFSSPVIIRWAQEMDLYASKFVWAQWSPEQYVNAYRHVMEVCRSVDSKALFMWSPQGTEWADAYYPGDQWVNLIGVSLFAQQKSDRDTAGHDRNFEELFSPIYARLAGYKKPIYLAEFAYEGDLKYVQNWSHTFSAPKQKYPWLKGVVYFNRQETSPWPNDWGRPNWRVRGSSLLGKAQGAN